MSMLNGISILCALCCLTVLIVIALVILLIIVNLPFYETRKEVLKRNQEGITETSAEGNEM